MSKAADSNASVVVLGHRVPERIAKQITNDATITLVNEGWLQAILGPALAWLALWFVGVCTAFLSSMRGADPARFRVLMLVGTVIAIGLGLAWAVWFHTYRKLAHLEGAQRLSLLMRLVGYHRLFAALLLIMFGIGGIVQSWTNTTGLGLTSTVLFASELAIGFRLVPMLLGFLVGEYRRAMGAALLLDKLLPILLGLLGLGSVFPLFSAISAQTMFFSLCHLVSAFATPWAVGMVAAATVYFRAAREPLSVAAR